MSSPLNTSIAEGARLLLALAAGDDDQAYDLAAVRWLGVLMAAHPELGLDRSGRVRQELRSLAGHSPEIARARLSLILRQVGEVAAAEVFERGAT